MDMRGKGSAFQVSCTATDLDYGQGEYGHQSRSHAIQARFDRRCLRPVSWQKQDLIAHGFPYTHPTVDPRMKYLRGLITRSTAGGNMRVPTSHHLLWHSMHPSNIKLSASATGLELSWEHSPSQLLNSRWGQVRSDAQEDHVLVVRHDEIHEVDRADIS